MNALTQSHDSGRSSPYRDVLGNRNFRLLWIGEGVSVLGDHFYMIALPWLVLQLTGDSLAMGTVLALSAIPRALLMLVGGALTDRFSPRSLMPVSCWCPCSPAWSLPDRSRCGCSMCLPCCSGLPMRSSIRRRARCQLSW